MKCRAIVKRPNENIKLEYIENNLENLQNIVEGYIEYPFISKLHNKGISIIVNEEGRLIDLEPSVVVFKNGRIEDYIYGNIIFIGNKDTDDGLENDNLSDEQIDFIKNNIFNGLKCIITNGKVVDVINV